MKKIYPVNFAHDIEFVVGPNLRVPGLTLCLVPIEKIIGFDLIQPCEEFKPIIFYPPPIALESHGLYFLIPGENYWRPDLVRVTASHILCLLISGELTETTRQEIISVVNHIHGNRTLLERTEVYDQVDHNNQLQDWIKSVYGIDSDIIKHLSTLLINNGYVKAPQKRKSSAKKQQKGDLSPVNRDSKEHKNTPENDHINLEDKWDAFAKYNHGVLTFNEIINAVPEGKRQQSRGRLYQLINEEESLMDVWEKVSSGLDKQNGVRAAS